MVILLFVAILITIIIDALAIIIYYSNRISISSSLVTTNMPCASEYITNMPCASGSNHEYALC